jgi:predicted nucleic acid-binding protein
LALALSAKAKVLVSSDVHLLEMHPFRGVQILQLTDFKQLFLGESAQQDPSK